MQIRVAKIEDIPYIVEIHMERFAHFFLSSLGRGFLSTYYTALLNKPGLLLVLEDEQKLNGFAAGSYSNNSFYKNLVKRNFLAFAKIGVNLVFTKPISLWRIFNNLFTASNEEMRFSELLSIATFKNNRGYGTALLQSFEGKIKQNPFKENAISLTTDYYNNEKIIAFYQANGYQIQKTFEGFGNRKMYRLIKKI